MTHINAALTSWYLHYKNGGTDTSEVKSVRMSDYTINALEDIAKRQGVSRASIIRDAINELLFCEYQQEKEVEELS